MNDITNATTGLHNLHQRSYTQNLAALQDAEEAQRLEMTPGEAYFYVLSHGKALDRWEGPSPTRGLVLETVAQGAPLDAALEWAVEEAAALAHRVRQVAADFVAHRASAAAKASGVDECFIDIIEEGTSCLIDREALEDFLDATGRLHQKEVERPGATRDQYNNLVDIGIEVDGLWKANFPLAYGASEPFRVMSERMSDSSSLAEEGYWWYKPIEDLVDWAPPPS